MKTMTNDQPTPSYGSASECRMTKEGRSTKPKGLMVRWLCCLLCLPLLAGCATKPDGTRVDNAATRTGQNLVGALATAFQDYADVKSGGVSSLWSISKGLKAYGQVVKSVADIKQLIVDWKATSGDGNLLQRVTEVLNNSDAPPQVKAAAAAKAAETVAANKGA